MTGQELLKIAYDEIGTTPGDETEFTPLAVGIINVLLNETFHVNNNLRLSKGLEELTAPQVIEALGEALTYEHELLYSCLPYGIAEKYAMYDDNPVNTGYYNSKYVNGVNACLRGIEQEHGVEDLY